MPMEPSNSQSQDSHHLYWVTQQTCQQANHGSNEPSDSAQESGVADNLLDRSGLFDELVSQILDENCPDIETEGNVLDNQQATTATDDHFNRMYMSPPSQNITSDWAQNKTDMMRRNPGCPNVPPGITERPYPPASMYGMYRNGVPNSLAKEMPPSSRGEFSDAKNIPPEYFQPINLMKGDFVKTPQFTGNIKLPLGRAPPSTMPSCRGDCGEIPILSSSSSNMENQYISMSRVNLRKHGVGPQGVDSHKEATEDPHQYFKQRVSEAQQAREQFSRLNQAAAPQLPISDCHQQTVYATQSFDPKLNSQNQWVNINNVMTKSNHNLMINNMAYDQNTFRGNANIRNPSMGKDRLPHHQTLQHALNQQMLFQMPNQNPSRQVPWFKPNQFPSQQSFSVRPEFRHQSTPIWQLPQHQQYPQNNKYLGQLHALEECYYQFYSIEKERKKTEIELSRLNPGRRISSANTIPTPQLPDNPTSLDRLIVDFYKEHSRVTTLMSKIGGLCAEALHPSIDACLDKWVDAIQETELKRREELLSSGRNQTERNAESPDHKDLLLVEVIQKLGLATRSIRTSLWCALQISKLNKVQCAE